MPQEPDPLPLPPVELVTRVGVPTGADPVRFYLDEGSRLRTVINELLPQDWYWEGKRVLDFGCGSARVLRHFAAEAARAEFIGCDIDGPSIAWAETHLGPTFRFFRNGLTPPVGLEAESLDLVLAMSVFTHIGSGWAAWLAEVHRLLAPGGLLLASFLGEGVWDAAIRSEYREDEVGMAIFRSWDDPHAWVFHSEWWLREHWGRGFDVVTVKRPARSTLGSSEITHSYIVVRKREGQLDAAALERADPTEKRELAAVQTSLTLARRDIEYLREEVRERVRPSRLRVAYRKLKRRLRERSA
jgi:SAM-dependent methyltransferase